jgi:hypothetical protein
MQGQTSRWLWSGLAVAAIWLSAVAASIWSPDLVTGADHEHIPLVALNAPIWALLATGFAVMAPAVTANDRRRVWAVYAGAVAVAWVAAAVISIAAPAMVTGSDPTTIPIAGVIAPIAAMAATAYATVGVVAVSARDETVGEAVDTVIRRIAEAAPQPR